MDTTVATTAPPGNAITEADLCTWLGMAAPGDQFIYHRGFLAVDCDRVASRLTERERAKLQRVARRARLAAENGLAHLVQRRNGPDDFTYLLVARPRLQMAEGSLKAIFSEAALSCPTVARKSIP
jgi:hypothetical protein